MTRRSSLFSEAPVDLAGRILCCAGARCLAWGGLFLADTAAQSTQPSRGVGREGSANAFSASDRTYGAGGVWHDKLRKACRVDCIGSSVDAATGSQQPSATASDCRRSGERQVAAVRSRRARPQLRRRPAPNRKWIADSRMYGQRRAGSMCRRRRSLLPRVVGGR